MIPESARYLYIVLLLFGMGAGGCATKPQIIELDPVELRARQTPQGPVVYVMDPEYLFKKGVEAYEQRDLEEAEYAFTLVIERFASTRFARPALFNRGVVRLAAGRPADAKADFAEYLQRYPEGPDRLDALHKLGQALVESGEWEAAAKVIRERLAHTPLTLQEEIEARARLTLALRMLGKIGACRKEAAKVYALYTKNVTLPEMEGNYYVAMASFYAAEALHDLFTRIKFVLPVERMEKDLQDKAILFLKAQAEYLRTARCRNIYWGVKAGMALARLYEEFFQHLLEAEIPADMEPDEIEIYFQELKRLARPLLVKAIDTYERNIAIAKAHGAKEEWFGDARERLVRLRKMLQSIPEKPPE